MTRAPDDTRLPEKVEGLLHQLLTRRTFGGPLAHETADELRAAIREALYEAEERGYHHALRDAGDALTSGESR